MGRTVSLILFFYCWAIVSFAQTRDPFKEVGIPGSFVYTNLKEALQEPASVSKMILTGPQDPKLMEKFKKLSSLNAVRFINNSFLNLPASLTGNASLMFLSSNGNALSDLPEDIGNLGNLMYLEIAGSNFDSFPESIGGLGRLKSIVIDVNTDTLFIPEAISNSKSLEQLIIYKCQLDTLPLTFNKLSSLKMLWLEECGISELPDSLQKITGLETLILDNNKLTSLPSGLYEITTLKKLSLRNNKISQISDFISRLEGLAELDLRGNPISEYDADILRILLPGCTILIK